VKIFKQIPNGHYWVAINADALAWCRKGGVKRQSITDDERRELEVGDPWGREFEFRGFVNRATQKAIQNAQNVEDLKLVEEMRKKSSKE